MSNFSILSSKATTLMIAVAITVLPVTILATPAVSQSQPATEPGGQSGLGVHHSGTYMEGRVAKRNAESEEATYRLSPSKDVVMNLSGTTPVKDWSMCARGLSGDAKMVVTRDNHLKGIHSLNFSLPVCNLKGEHKGMEDDAHAALKADRYHDIIFKLASATIEQKDDSRYEIAAHGTLTVAGVTRTVTLRMVSLVAQDGAITFTGSEGLRMSDYDVERPSVLFGAIKADDKMTLTYNLIFTK